MLKYEIIQNCTHAMICNPVTTNFVTKPHFAFGQSSLYLYCFRRQCHRQWCYISKTQLTKTCNQTMDGHSNEHVWVTCTTMGTALNVHACVTTPQYGHTSPGLAEMTDGHGNRFRFILCESILTCSLKTSRFVNSYFVRYCYLAF